MSVWRIVESPVIIVADNDRIVVVAVMPANAIARRVIAIIDKIECRARIVIIWTVAAIVIRARRIIPEIVSAILMAIVMAIIMLAIIAVEIPVIAVMSVAAMVPVIVIAIVLPGPHISARLTVSAII